MSLDLALKSLKAQDIPVSRGIIGPNGPVFDVRGFMLTAAQILKLSEYDQVTMKGIQAFAKSVEGNSNAAKAVPTRWPSKS
jgi:hypothetical protein